MLLLNLMSEKCAEGEEQKRDFGEKNEIYLDGFHIERQG
jgi:hypothetical protein